MQTRQEKIAQFAKMMFSAAPEYRKSYVRPPVGGGKGRISHHMVFCMFILHAQKQMSMSALSEKLGVSNQQMTRIVTELVESGFATRSQDGANRRLINISLSEKGEAEVMRFFRLGFKHIESHLSPLSDEELDSLIYHMSEVVRLTQKL